MNSKFILITLILAACCYTSHAQGTVKYCDVHIDSTSFDTVIQKAMLNGTAQDVINAIDTGKITIDTAVGCGIESYNYFPATYIRPQFLQVSTNWYDYQYKKFDTLITSCPGLGRDQASIALAGYYARLAGFPSGVGLDTLNVSAENFLNTQYDSTRAPTPLAYTPGVYGYLIIPPTNSCYGYINIGGDNDIVNHYSDTTATQYWAIYNTGNYAGDSFYVCDYDTSTFWLWGGLSYDQAWTTAMMIQAAIQQPYSSYKTQYTNSAIESAQWAMQEPPEVLSEATSGDIWILADMYDWTGNKAYYNSMVDKLNRGLLPGVLTDFIKPGYVDGMNNKPFDSLTILAQVPGRLWDPSDALVWNTARCTNSVVEAYVACRDRGDDSEAQALKPYVNAMMNNICWQVNNFGVFALSIEYRDIDYTIINAIWKIEEYENEPHPGWDSTAWALYYGSGTNGFYKYFGLPTVDIALYLLIVDSVRYNPVFAGIELPVLNDIEQVQVYPNPSNGKSVLKFFVTAPAEIEIKITDITGAVVQRIAGQQFNSGPHTVNLNNNNLSAGMYLVWLQSGHQNKVLKWIKNN